MVPTIGAASLALTGLLLMAVPILYSAMVPYKAGPSGRLLVAGRTVPVSFGPCVWVTVLGGLWATVVGTILYIYHSRYPNIFFTDFDLDYEEHEETRRKSLAQE